MKCDTTRQRLALYKEVLGIFLDGGKYFMCHLLNSIIDDEYDDKSLYELLPEWAAQKPKHLGDRDGSWFRFNDYGNKERIRVIRNCIDECERKIKQNELRQNIPTNA